MKKIVTLLLISLFFFFFLFILCNSVPMKENLAKNMQISKVDYPLIDIIFENKSEWLVIIRTELFTEHEQYYIAHNTENLDMNKEGLMISTFPVGRGTTPNGVVYVYQNKELFKEVPFIEISFENVILKRAFKNIAKEDIDKLIGGLPPLPI